MSSSSGIGLTLTGGIQDTAASSITAGHRAMFGPSQPGTHTRIPLAASTHWIDDEMAGNDGISNRPSLALIEARQIVS